MSTKLQINRYNIMDSVEAKVLESYFGEYSPFAKAYRTKGGKDVFCHDMAKFMLEVACESPRQYYMPKQRVGFIIATYKGTKVDRGYITGVSLREQLHDVQNGKSMKPIFARWLAVLCPTSIANTGCKWPSSQALRKQSVRRIVFTRP